MSGQKNSLEMALVGSGKGKYHWNKENGRVNGKRLRLFGMFTIENSKMIKWMVTFWE